MIGAQDGLGLWLMIALLAIGTFAMRFGFQALPSRAQPTRRLKRALDTLPAAILAGVAAPMVALDDAGALGFDPPVAAAAAATLLVGGLTRRFMWALGAGLAVGLGVEVAARALLG